MAEKIVLTELQVTEAFLDWFKKIDGDEIARITGEAFGGECFYKGDHYHFYPNSSYYGQFHKEWK